MRKLLLIFALLIAHPVFAQNVATQGLSITVTQHTVGLSWSAPSGSFTGYHVWRSTTNGSGYAVQGTVGSGTTIFTDNTNVIAGTVYYYVVTAYNNIGDSSNSNQVSATIPTP